MKYQVQLTVQNNLAPHQKEAISEDDVDWDCIKKALIDLSVLCDFVYGFLVQWFGFTPHSPSEMINCKADFMCQGISALLKHKHNTCMYHRIKAKGQKMSQERTKRNSHLGFCLGINSHHVLSAGGSHKGAGLSVLLH